MATQDLEESPDVEVGLSMAVNEGGHGIAGE